ncbi:Mannose-P-dolichol utilization defect 1 protein-like protein [Mycena venus]|uniref:Mannose-P-dolichol utilization defect 1 protein-like protein n=1 Tax=Mycena venus TaxID=2733690 RepID=A0A8H6YH11_9AGAR|nr:Mannose-P-dolichol utilization defect 1 protein-like protein [Mycena venus]
MTSITRNLPWFIRDLGISIVGKKCYTSLIENLDIGDVECIKYSISKGLGIGIVVGGSIVKVPQLLLIVRAQSARGLSLPAYILETLSYAITLEYAYRNEFPFSTYGENLFLTIQNVLITILIILYAPRVASTDKTANAVIASLGMLVFFLGCSLIPLPMLAVLQLTTLPLSLFSKIPQIQQNYRAQSTGQLSAFAVLSQVLGCAARLFTTATEVGDSIVAAGFALALVLNLVLGAQLWMYWGRDDVEAPAAVTEKVKARASPAPAASTTSTSVPAYKPEPASWQRAATPPPSSPSLGGRKWARKVD